MDVSASVSLGLEIFYQPQIHLACQRALRISQPQVLFYEIPDPAIRDRHHLFIENNDVMFGTDVFFYNSDLWPNNSGVPWI